MGDDSRGGFAALDPCVHCGFCLSACPTYLATGDESESPRGRIHLMRALERGELTATDDGLAQHLDSCLGCRGCEPACPSGVGYGRGLETARERLTRANGLPARARIALGVFARSWAWRPLFGMARVARGTGLLRRLAGPGRLGFLSGMLDATTPIRERLSNRALGTRRSALGGAAVAMPAGATVALFRGCVMNVLFDHVHEATRRTLEANGYRVVEVQNQACCGALHEHAGDRAGAARLAERNVTAFDGVADFVAVNSAGCGALLKDVGHLLGTEAAGRVAGSVRDVSELLAERGPRSGGELPLTIAYDAPCHLQHAQRVHREPLAVLRAIPGLRLTLLPGSDRCCGSAGLYGVLHPELSRAVLADKVAAIAAASPRPDVVATGNPGCLMQIGAGLTAEGLGVAVAHPIELLDWSYERAGLYRTPADPGSASPALPPSGRPS